jgi:hypothetical protein
LSLGEQWQPPVVTATDDAALVYDEYTDMSRYDDPATGKWLTADPPPPVRRRELGRLQLLDGSWKLVEHTQFDPPAPGDGDIRAAGPPSVPQPQLSEAEQVGIAFGRSRQLLAHARATGDGSALPQLMAGDALQQEQAALGQQPPPDHEIDSRHYFSVATFGPDDAEVYDAFFEWAATDPSVADVPSPPLQHLAARLQWANGEWKVVSTEPYQ